MSKRHHYRYKELVLSYLRQYPELYGSTIAKKILEENSDINVSETHMIQVVQTIRRNNEIITIKNEDDPMSPGFKVMNETYYITTKRGEVEISVAQADQLFYEYSRHGLNMSQTSVRNKHDIKIWEWFSLKRSLNLYKDSHIFSPWTVDNTPTEEYQQMVSQKMEFKERDKQRIVEAEHEKTLRKHYNKAIDQRNRKKYGFEKMIDELADLLPEVKVKDIRRSSNNEYNGENKNGMVFVADIHVGAEVRDLDMTPDFDLDAAKDIMTRAANAVNSYGFEKVHLNILGDIIETFTGLNHLNSWKSVGYGMYGAKVVVAAVELLEHFFSEINNLYSVNVIAGNHDRSTSNKGEDDRGEIAELICYVLKRVYTGCLEINFNPLVITKVVDDINYIMVHGDKNLIKKDPKDFIFEYGDKNMYNVILSGHLHERAVKKDTSKYRWIQCPSIFTGNWYSEKNNWHSYPGVTVCCNAGENLPRVVDEPIRPGK